MKEELEKNPQSTISSSQVFFIHVCCGLALVAGFWVAHHVYSLNLVFDPTKTLCLIWAIEFPVVILLFSCCRQKPEKCSYFTAIARGLLGLPIGALLNALGALALGAPVGLQYLEKTVNWSLLMSSFTFVPTACVYGSSWTDWCRIFACTKPNGPLEFMLCLPAHGAVIGAWFGAWPMPLDWERPWQDWPICVSYGAMAGYVVGMVGSFGLALIMHTGRKQLKAE
ncbi:Phosphatidylinositol-glycan biosynthesis class F [Gossypium arboreum]|uniref:Phosphatidylinositol-glycan biosynthesis class F n=5 Tax=Gossypium TaxID=3633 RepID=A0A0B0PL88_GOSAR|nr:phosphatidylinositol-glycan biosynthesis class F protein [Gossypium hirsutum]XP_017604008.1 uncharacterized protein LOC108450759 [Gossypium arboreum]TYH16550.1 hypothetical protein ES288_A05G125200v1 [Gossypium darwinii]TYI26645.1 hypothetical protein ES332_A05G126700v1 [Gossypium tomentosum]KAG4198940.1 hypothetical protein ERO13_A05G117500v2 [Gossypium hirsutum]KAK5830882.1 hypothetical protein PVK06_014677 [Gossypium arboreum]KHG25189.1 Phosphatidylinositol-glycan biosynthesis class F [